LPVLQSLFTPDLVGWRPCFPHHLKPYGPVDAIFMLLFAQQGIAAVKKNRDDDAAGLKRA
jgi:hypothetical protein